MSSSPPKKRLKTDMELRPPQSAALPAPIQQGPSAKERKYDRQLRLWAASGQAALENAHVLLLNSGPGVVGVESLKNLVLPGVGQFTILDPAIVTEADLGVNFFLEEEDLGKSRAEGCVRLLLELNPDVQGHAIAEPFETFLLNPDNLRPYSLIICTLPIKPELLDVVSTHAATAQVPAFYVHSVGFYGHFNIHLPSAFPIVDTHPDPATTTDLRLLEPWPELSAFALDKTLDIDQQDEETHGHIPWVVILLYALERWKATSNGAPPSTYTEKTKFRDLVTSLGRTNTAEGSEENFDEAVAAVLKSLNPHAPSSAVREVLDAPESQQLTPTSLPFWIIANAVRTFYKNHTALPLSGALPDMKAKSADYIALQTIYRSKAQADAAEVLDLVRQLEANLGRPDTARIPAAQVEAFCKSAASIKLVRGGRAPHIARPGQLVQFKDRAADAVVSLSDPFGGVGLLTLYLAMLAYDSYAASHPDFPSQDPAIAAHKMTGIAHAQLDALITEAATRIDDPDYSAIKAELAKMAAEIARAAGGELHNVASLVGGIVAQEAIKVVTEQYVPVDNCCVFDGVASKTAVFRV